VQRPSAARPHRVGAVDRRLALGAFSLVAVVLLGVVAVARAPLPEIYTNDPAAARDLVALMKVGERGSWIVSYDFTRTLANGRVLREAMSEGRSPTLHVVITGSSMTIDRSNGSYDCAVVGARTGCERTSRRPSLPASEVLRVAVSLGAYDVVREPGKTIAGMRAQCFRVRATGGGGLPDLGVETELCLSRGGIVLRRAVVRPPGDVDEEVASSVRVGTTRAAVDALARSFAPRNSGSGR
jgi:hypothetical protein